MQRLARGEARVVDLVAELGLAQSTISKHLACLRDCHAVTLCPAPGAARPIGVTGDHRGQPAGEAVA